MTIPCKVKLQKDGLVVEVEGDKEFVTGILKQYSPLLPAGTATSASEGSGHGKAKAEAFALQKGAAKTLSPGEFVANSAQQSTPTWCWHSVTIAKS